MWKVRTAPRATPEEGVAHTPANPPNAGFVFSAPHTVDSLTAELSESLGLLADKLGVTIVNARADLPANLASEVLRERLRYPRCLASAAHARKQATVP